MKGLRMTQEEYDAWVSRGVVKKAAPVLPKSTESAAQAMHRSLGRMGGGKMNKSEAAYAAHLDALKSVGQILWYRFEGMKFRLADNTFYTPDFAVIVASGALELHEFKGFMEEDANVKIKTAATQYPFVFRLVRKAKGGGFDIRGV
ncbi:MULTISPECIES: DUF1064 domain-containing protein [Paraburkholderia]|uniref:DUF1064 domain-containing protein n=1 Tax=Paraburkholderia TaxID=1822464 RepID=UPI002250BF84|nr:MULTISPECIES: DUF1064 domain-containing protein [Paraburkholderia]MCX4154975.1 DUF1064 domain-containing protein [Paraburkholderia aspalathi]MDN7164385.1 DUF1064 domain-containing protein [Paraburkholderia sp. SECH2]MDQ6392870.1 DUF1064 domain-containing protein [Paraburkholderia aspalathi]